MKNTIVQKRRFTIWISLLLAFWVTLLNKPIDVASEQPNQVSNSAYYYELARQSEQINDYVSAGIYLQLYRQLNPPEYAQNISNQKNIVDGQMKRYMDDTKIAIAYYKKEFATCGKFPCNQAGSENEYTQVPIQPLPPPPNAVILCTGRNYTGTCKVLYVGDYTNLTQMNINDQISSVMIGSRVRLILYRHARFDSLSFVFNSNDPDLSDNRIDNSASWNDVASAAKVQNK